MFDNYLYPAFLKLYEDGDIVVKQKFVEIIPDLINIGKMLITSVSLHKQTITMLAKQEQNAPDIDQEERELLLFENTNMVDELTSEGEEVVDGMYKIEKYHMEDVEEEENNEAEGERDSKIEEAKSTTDADYSHRDLIRSILDDQSIVQWSRKRFTTEEQKVRSVVGMGYNISLNDNDDELSDDPENENELEREIDGLREKIYELTEKIIFEQTSSAAAGASALSNTNFLTTLFLK